MVLLTLKFFALCGLAAGTFVLFVIALRGTTASPPTWFKPLLVWGNFLSGTAILSIVFLPIPLFHKFIFILWKGLLVIISQRSWKKNTLVPSAYFIPAVLGLGLCYLLAVDIGVLSVVGCY